MKPKPFHQHIVEYKNQLQKGIIQCVYKGITDYLNQLRMHLEQKYPDYFVSEVHFGQMDYSYFYFFPRTLKQKNLKVVIIFSHDTIKFDVWLAGYNKAAQTKYWSYFKKKGLSKYNIATNLDEEDFIVAHTLSNDPDFSRLDDLTNKLEAGIICFIQDVENSLNSKPK